MTFSSLQTVDLAVLQKQCYDNSVRWFPTVHQSFHFEVVHATLGLCGEQAEYESAHMPDKPHELADVLIYLMVLAEAWSYRLVLSEPRYESYPCVGRLAEQVKKLHKHGTITGGVCPPGVAEAMDGVLHWVYGQETWLRCNLLKAVDEKMAICEERHLAGGWSTTL